ncbi:MAG: YlmC/YmxH family sporulation protein [Bacilli bacterium]|nr:YlmC/YmxH family sporulation protein [Bacilli bacterium]
MMRLSDLQSKNLVNINDGKNIGNIIDAKVNEEDGSIKSLIIEAKGSMFSFLNKDSEVEIFWSDIKKIGEDVILVNIK